jgi:type IV secretion system protein VirD4
MSKQRSTNTILKLILAGTVIGLILLAYVSAGIGELITPTGTFSWNVSELGATIRAGRFQWPGAATWILVVLVAAGIFGTGWVLFSIPAKPESRRPDSGLPGYKDLEPRVGKEAAVATARQSLTLPENVEEKDVVTTLCTLDGEPVYFQHEDSMWVFAPQRSGKTLWLAVGILIDAPGAVIATSTKIDLFLLTALMRSGTLEAPRPVLVFDLQGISGWPKELRWDPIAGCEDPDEAMARGKAWAGAQPMNGVKGGDWFNSKAAATLSRYLHAAALEGKTMMDVLDWANDFNDTEPLEILQRRSPGFAKRLEKNISSRAGETIDSVQETLLGLLEPLYSPRAMETLTPGPGAGFDVEEFLDARGTLYLLTDGEESPVAPIVTMFADHLFRKAQKISQSRPGGRLWPPLTMVLDEAPNTAAFPNMASALSDSGGRGIRIIGFSQSFAQNRGRWGETPAEMIRGTSSVRMILPGLEEHNELDRMAAAAGVRMVERKSRSVTDGKETITYREEEVPVIRGSEIQQMKRGEAFMHHTNLPPTIVDLIPYWERPDGEEIKARKKVLEEYLLSGNVTEQNIPQYAAQTTEEESAA